METPVSQLPLIIGYGNTLRGDDGVGPAVATQLQVLLKTGQARVLVRPQLTFELAEDVSQAPFTLLIDAAGQGTPGTVGLHEIQPAKNPGSLFQHHVPPQVLLATAQILYDRLPPMTLISVAGMQFDQDRMLSDVVQRAIPEVIDIVQKRLAHYWASLRA